MVVVPSTEIYLTEDQHCGRTSRTSSFGSTASTKRDANHLTKPRGKRVSSGQDRNRLSVEKGGSKNSSRLHSGSNSVVGSRNSSFSRRPFNLHAFNRLESEIEKIALDEFEDEQVDWNTFQEYISEIDRAIHLGYDPTDVAKPTKGRKSSEYTQVTKQLEREKTRRSKFLQNWSARIKGHDITETDEDTLQNELDLAEAAHQARVKDAAMRGWVVVRRYVNDMRLERLRKSGGTLKIDWDFLKKSLKTMSNMDASRQDLYERYGWENVKKGKTPRTNPEGPVVKLVRSLPIGTNKAPRHRSAAVPSTRSGSVIAFGLSSSLVKEKQLRPSTCSGDFNSSRQL